MEIYGNECNGGGFSLFANGEFLGDYPSPVNIIETYLGEPYVEYINEGNIGGRQAWRFRYRRGDGLLLFTNSVVWDSQAFVGFTPPTTENGDWLQTVNSLNFYYGGSWNFFAGRTSVYGKIPRYTYTVALV